jgi:hypothetical protein
MKITFRKSLLYAALLCAGFACLSSLHAADAKAAAKDSQSLLIEMRLKRWTKELEFTADQQAKIKALLEEESKTVAKVDEDTSLAVGDRAKKVDEIHKTTYAKIKPLLTEKQLPVFEKLTIKTKTTKQKKVAAPANP